MAAAIGGGFAAYSYFQAQPCATFPSALSDPAFQRAVGIGMLAGAVGGLIGFGVGIVGVGAFGGGLAGAIISGAVGGGLAGGVGEALRQVATYGHIRNPQLLGAAMLSGVVSGGAFGAIGYGLRSLRTPAASNPNAIDRIGEEAAGSTERAFAPGKWLPHYEKHGAEFGYKTPIEYLRGAQRLTAGGEGIQTFVRANGDTLFYITHQRTNSPSSAKRVLFEPTLSQLKVCCIGSDRQEDGNEDAPTVVL